MTTDDAHQKIFAAGYLRCWQSNDPAIENLERQIRAFVVVRDYNLVAIYRDEGESARIGSQPGLARAIRQIEQRKCTYLIVPTWHYLARRLGSAGQLIEQIRSYGGEVLTIN